MGNAKSTDQKTAGPKISLPKDEENGKDAKKGGSKSSPNHSRTSLTGSDSGVPKGSRSTSMSSQGSKGKHPLSLTSRAIIRSCFDNVRADLCERIYRRVMEKREDFRNFAEHLGQDRWSSMADALRDYLLTIVEAMNDIDEVQRLSEEFGARHVQFRSAGFKPDFLVTTADAVTQECVFLDLATHPAGETLLAWSTLTAIMFSAVRDGYYAEVRRLRRTADCFGGRGKNSIDLSTDGSTRSASPGNERLSFSNEPDDDMLAIVNEEPSMNFLQPPNH